MLCDMRTFIRVVISVIAGFFLMWPLGYVYGLLGWPTFHGWGAHQHLAIPIPNPISASVLDGGAPLIFITTSRGDQALFQRPKGNGLIRLSIEL